MSAMTARTKLLIIAVLAFVAGSVGPSLTQGWDCIPQHQGSAHELLVTSEDHGISNCWALGWDNGPYLHGVDC